MEGQIEEQSGRVKKVKQMSCFSSTLTQKFYFAEPDTLSQLDSMSVSNEAELSDKKRELKNETKKTRRLEKELEEKQRQIEQLRVEVTHWSICEKTSSTKTQLSNPE